MNNHFIQDALSAERIVTGIFLLIAIFFQEVIKELAHSIKLKFGFASNLTIALSRDRKIDELLHQFAEAQPKIASVILVKITNGGGIPKEGSPLNSCITNPVERRNDWPLTEVSPFYRDIIQEVYLRRRFIIPIEFIPHDDSSYSYLKMQKANIRALKLLFIKEKSKCRILLSVRLLCEVVEFREDVKLSEDLRQLTLQLRKLIR